MSKKYFLLLSLATLVGACSAGNPGSTGGTITLNSKAIEQDKSLSPVDKAEKLALAGEQLVTPVGFMYANDVFDTALNIDSNNFRAKFYKALIAPAMALKGSFKRLSPMIEKTNDETVKAEYKKLVDSIPESGARDFLFDGHADIDSEIKLMDFASEIRESINNQRLFFKNNKDTKIVLNINALLAGVAIEHAMSKCPIEEIRPGVYEITQCSDIQKVLKVEVSRPDMEALQQATAGALIYTIGLTSYDFPRLIELIQAGFTTTKQFTVAAKSIPGFGKLRKDNRLSLVVDMGVDAVAATRWALSLQRELCPMGIIDENNRPGTLVRHGICIPSRDADAKNSKSTTEVLALIEDVLSGKLMAVNVVRTEYAYSYVAVPVHYSSGSTGYTYENISKKQAYTLSTSAQPLAPLISPVEDLTTLLPTKFDQNGNGLNIGDNSLGGILPKQNATEVSTFCNKMSDGTPSAGTYWQTVSSYQPPYYNSNNNYKLMDYHYKGAWCSTEFAQ